MKLFRKRQQFIEELLEEDRPDWHLLAFDDPERLALWNECGRWRRPE